MNKEKEVTTYSKILWVIIFVWLLFTAYQWRQIKDLTLENEKLWVEVLKYEDKQAALDNMWAEEKAAYELDKFYIKHGYEP